MSQRAIRRAQQRHAAKARRRAKIATGAAVGAAALFAAPAAQAANLTVTTTADSGGGVCDPAPGECTLRDAINTANNNGEDDTITFASGVTGTIQLAGGLGLGGDNLAVTIQGPGADELSISGNDEFGIFTVTSLSRFEVSDLTLEHGQRESGSGGAIYGSQATLTVSDSVLSDNSAAYGGAIAGRGDLTVLRSELTNNSADGRGGAIDLNAGPSGSAHLAVVESTISGSTAGRSGGAIEASGDTGIYGSDISDNISTEGAGGGIFANRGLRVEASRISGNSAPAAAGGGIARAEGKYGPLDVLDSEISGNSALAGGGISMASGTYGARSAIGGSTISGNSAGTGAGIYARVEREADRLTIARTTISGNDAGTGNGGGIRVAPYMRGDIDVFNSTISGNKAGTGAGASVDAVGEVDDLGRVAFANSTIASNAATVRGGGIYLRGGDDVYYGSPDVRLQSTIVGDNAPADLDRSDNALNGVFRFAFSLVENTGSAPFVQSADAPSIIGQDPQLGPLADNGGSTLTHLPATTSPAIENGLGDPDTTDQRGLARVVDGEGPNATNGDGADIGAVEIDNPPAQPKPPEDPPPDNPPPGDPPPGNSPPPQTTPQDLPPQAVIKRNGLRSKSSAKRFASGTANDDHAVVAVDVAIVRKRGNKCRQLLPSGKFSKATRCHGPKVFQPAEGTTRWRFDLKQSLDPGYYVVYSRAVDDSGRKQVSFGTKSRRPFRVR